MFRSRLIRFIEDNLQGSAGGAIAPDESLIDRGLIDSIGLMRIMQFVETQTGVRIPDHYVTPDNFQSVVAIEEMVEQIRGVAGGAG